MVYPVFISRDLPEFCLPVLTLEIFQVFSYFLDSILDFAQWNVSGIKYSIRFNWESNRMGGIFSFRNIEGDIALFQKCFLLKQTMRILYYSGISIHWKGKQFKDENLKRTSAQHKSCKKQWWLLSRTTCLPQLMCFPGLTLWAPLTPAKY